MAPALLQLYSEFIALGILAGFLAGLLGIGGGMVLVPFLTALLTSDAVGVPADLGVKMAIATSMATIVFTSASSVYAHQKRGALRWDLVKLLAPGIVLGSLIASAGVFALLKGRWLAAGFGVFVAYSAVRMLASTKGVADKPMPGPAGITVAGGAIGFLSGMVGAGGGFISVPYMARRGVAIHSAVATSAALGFPIALSNVAGYIYSGMGVQNLPEHSIGYVWVPALVVVALCSMATAPLGARAAHALPVDKLKRIFATLLFMLSAYMLYKAARG
jgi:uncharacterized membrane protein YfcA